ncbi:MAG TPA: alanine racemase [Nocardioidaceae bacterium]|jgi:alanine racemase|nr:alanine racemase [Nocardioidaceae bacterium]
MTDTGPRAEIVVDLDAIRGNVAALKRYAAGAAMMTVVKADGYGHGMAQVARAAREAGAEWLGVATLDEALALRAGGDEGPVLAWLTVPGEDYRRPVATRIDVSAYTVAELDEITAAARAVGVPARVQLKVDTGLNRGGASPADWPDLVAAAAKAEGDGHATVTGVWSHLACSDEPDHPANDAQERSFRRALEVVDEAGLAPEVRHLANSAATVSRPSAHFDLVRCGIASYGHSPIPGTATSADLGLVPAMTVRGRFALVKPVPAGQGVSYGYTYITAQDTTVGVVPMGYGDGVPRHASSAAPVLAAGRVRTIAGRVCMDQFVLDLEGDRAAAGDPVVLFGPGTDGEPTAQDWADACGTISYEIVTRVGGRMRRSYRGTRERG